MLFFLLLPFAGFAQKWDIGMMAGGSYYYGDVSNELKSQNIRYSGLVFLRKQLDDRTAMRVNLAYTRIAGIDSVSSSKFQRGRNLNFFTDIFEVSAQLEYNLIADNLKSKKRPKIIPYIYGGLGAMYFIPQTLYQGKRYNLAQLQTAGIKYSQVALALPLGFGVRYYFNPRWQIGIEAGLRLTSTSDLDDIRGSSLYPDPANLPGNDSRLVYDRSNQAHDADSGIGYGHPGRTRGKIKMITDVYMIYGLTLACRLGDVSNSKQIRKSGNCPRFY